VADPDPADRPLRARPDPVAGEVPAPEPAWLSTLAQGEPGLSRVAALGRSAQASMRACRASECMAALDEQREAAGSDPGALVWALTMSAVCRSIFGQLTRARADLAEAKQNCLYAAPLLARPYWRFADIVRNWLGGNWTSAYADAAALSSGQETPVTPVLAGVVLALRTETLRGLGLARESRLLADRLAGAAPAELSAWVRAGLDADDGRGAEALRGLADVCDIGTDSAYRVALPLVLHRMAAIAFGRSDRRVAASAAEALAGLDQAAPLVEILGGLARAYAAGDPRPARRAQELAEAEGAGMLAAEALTVRGQVGDDPAQTLAAAHAAWERIGAPARAEAVATLMRGAGLAVPPARSGLINHVPATGAEVLTPRERSVAVLVHEGRTNQQIAHTLNISVKTVEAYLTRLYRKTSCSSRVELAVAVTERRLIITGQDDAAGPA
jgi:DNA-binding CsgD family transcriptional regulator